MSEGHGSLWSRLLENWPAYLVYVISFATIGVMWANHHSIFPVINRASHGLVTANLALLLVVAFIPFPTKVLGDNLREASFADQRTAALFYNGTFLMMAVAYNVIWQTAAWRNRNIEPGCEEAVAEVTRRYWPGAPSYILAMLASLWKPIAGIAVNSAIMAAYMLPWARSRDEAPR